MATSTVQEDWRGRRKGRQTFELVCPVCKKPYLYQGGPINAAKRQFCSHACAGLGRPHGNVTEATEHPTVRDTAWAAGLFEGEGHSSPTTRGKSTQCNIAQKDVWVLQRCLALFGGSVSKPNKRGVSYWRAYGGRSRGFLMTIYTFLSPWRRRQAEKAIGNA